MKKVYHEFDFNELNFEEEKNRFLNFASKAINDNIELSSLNEFPPCIIDSGFISQNTGAIVLSDKNYLLRNNLFYGEEYKKINEKFKDSPFIAKDCRGCKHYKDYTCRGLFNEKFLKMQDRITESRGLKEYNALKIEYLFGNVGISSNCNVNCIFCGEKPRRKTNFIFKFVETPLSIKEILHFIHYLPSYGVKDTFFVSKCSAGESLLHKDIMKYLKILDSFSVGQFNLTTNGLSLNDEILNFISKSEHMWLSFSLHTIDNELRQKNMGYKKNMDLKNLITKIKKSGVKFDISLVVLKSNIVTGDLKNTITFLKENGIVPGIRKNSLNYYYSYEEVLDEFDYPEEFLINYLKEVGLFEDVLMAFTDKQSVDMVLSFIDPFKKFLRSLEESKKILVLTPIQYSYAPLKENLSDMENVFVEPVSSKLGFNIVISASIQNQDFIDTLSKVNYDYDYIVLPKGSYDFLMNDILNNNINELASELDKKIYLL